MNIRKRFRAHAEIHTGALNDILFILLLFFLIVSTLANPNVVKVNNPKGKSDTKTKQNIVISIDKNHNIFMGQNQVSFSNIDTLLQSEVLKVRQFVDTPSVVINADTVAYYGEVFRIMNAAKKSGARVVANISN